MEVHDTLQRNHVEFYPSLSAALELRERVRNTSEGMKDVETRLEKEVGWDESGHFVSCQTGHLQAFSIVEIILDNYQKV